MDVQITVTIISSAFILAGTIITVLASSHRRKIEQDLKQEYLQREIENLQADVSVHNEYAVNIPLILQKIEFIEQQIKEIKEHDKNVA